MRYFLGLLVVVVACSDDGGSMDAAVRALDVAFDKSSSTLGATNVQDALDELAQRPVAEAPVGPRIKTVVDVKPNPGTAGTALHTASCPDPVHDLALGGACPFGGDGAELAGSDLSNDTNLAQYTCAWRQPSGASGNMRAVVTCLTAAR